MNKVPPPPIFGQTFLLFWEGTAAQQQQQSLGLGLGPRADLQQGEGGRTHLKNHPQKRALKKEGEGEAKRSQKEGSFVSMPFLVHGIFCPIFLVEGLFFWIMRRLKINIQ